MTNDDFIEKVIKESVQIDPITEQILLQEQEKEHLQESFGIWDIGAVFKMFMDKREEQREAFRNRTIAATILAAIILAAAYKVYKSYLSKAAKACKGKSGEEKTKCMKSYKEQARQKEITGIRKLMGECSKSKNPVKCKSLLKKKLDKKMR